MVFLDTSNVLDSEFCLNPVESVDLFSCFVSQAVDPVRFRPRDPICFLLSALVLMSVQFSKSQ